MSFTPSTRRVLRSSLVGSFVILAGVAFAWVVPKTDRLPLNEHIYTGYYRGFETENDGFLGKHYFRVRAKEAYGYWEVDCPRTGYWNYRAYYPNGRLQAEGTIYVEYMGVPKQPYPDHHNVRNAKYYDPEGVLVSTIADGTGRQVLCYPNGQIRWELELRHYKRVEHRLWGADGRLLSHKKYDNK